MREYMGYYLTGDVWNYPRWCDGSVLTYLLKDENIGKFKNKDYNKSDTSDFDISFFIFSKSFGSFKLAEKLFLFLFIA